MIKKHKLTYLSVQTMALSLLTLCPSLNQDGEAMGCKHRQTAIFSPLAIIFDRISPPPGPMPRREPNLFWHRVE